MIEINGKVYRNLQEQVAKNQSDIEDLQEADQTFATKTYVDDSITTVNNRINNILVAEDDEYKTELVFEPDDAYLKYYDKDPEDPQEYEWGLVQRCFDIDRLQQIHLYAHNVQLSVKLKDAGVTADTYTGRVNLTLYLSPNTPLTEATLKQRVQMGIRVSATGFAIDTVREKNYTIIALVKYADFVSTDLEVDLVPSNGYAASGLITSIIGEITNFTDKVAVIY